MHELRDEAEPTLQELLPRIQGCDLLLVEGFKSGEFPKLEVWRAEVGKPMLWPDWPGIVAVASDAPPPSPAPRWLDLAATQALVELVLAEAV
jgi:molybdopterin-guanine dinucleotide biosynthesis adapter protein